jgi:hypothetical protein
VPDRARDRGGRPRALGAVLCVVAAACAAALQVTLLLPAALAGDGLAALAAGSAFCAGVALAVLSAEALADPPRAVPVARVEVAGPRRALDVAPLLLALLVAAGLAALALGLARDPAPLPDPAFRPRGHLAA